jgi:hypothetical protein
LQSWDEIGRKTGGMAKEERKTREHPLRIDREKRERGSERRRLQVEMENRIQAVRWGDMRGSAPGAITAHTFGRQSGI